MPNSRCAGSPSSTWCPPRWHSAGSRSCTPPSRPRLGACWPGCWRSRRGAVCACCGSAMLVPLYHAGQLVGLWSVRHSDPTMYRQSDGDLLELLAPQLALMVAIDGSLRPVTGASDQTTQYVQTLTATTEEIHASSEEVAAAAQRASHGAGQAANLVSTAAREAGQLKETAAEPAAA